MAKYRCTVCNWVYDDAKEKVKFTDLPKEWVCPICGAPKSAFVLLSEEKGEKEAKPEKKAEAHSLRRSNQPDRCLGSKIRLWHTRHIHLRRC